MFMFIACVITCVTILLLTSLWSIWRCRQARRLAVEACEAAEVWEAREAYVAALCTMDAAIATFKTEAVHQVKEVWKDYAIALEVLCETAAEEDAAGAMNAATEVARNREILRVLGEYDA
jgi:hypothetical protein